MIWATWLSIAAAGVVDDGANAFEAGQLDQAISAWEAPRDEGARASGIVEYNLGTAWLRKGDAPRAIARLRAAGRLRPRDGAIHHNLALARSELDTVPPAMLLPSAWMSVVTPGELGLLGLLLALLGSGWVVGHRLGRTTSQLPGLGFLTVGLVIGGIASVGSSSLANHPIAVIVDAEAVLRDAPSVNAGERFRLGPGSEVRVDRQYQAFMLIEDGHGRRGWLAAGAAEKGW